MEQTGAIILNAFVPFSLATSPPLTEKAFGIISRRKKWNYKSLRGWRGKQFYLTMTVIHAAL